MTATPSLRPAPDESSTYFRGYIDQVPDGDPQEILRRQAEQSCSLLEDLGEEGSLVRYAEGKWSVRELLAHVIDIERIFGGRAVRIARGDTTPLPGVDHNVLIEGGDFDARSLASLLHEFRAVRAASCSLFETLTSAQFAHRGMASDAPFTARAIQYFLVGHEAHHLRIVRERYLPVVNS